MRGLLSSGTHITGFGTGCGRRRVTGMTPCVKLWTSLVGAELVASLPFVQLEKLRLKYSWPEVTQPVSGRSKARIQSS